MQKIIRKVLAALLVFAMVVGFMPVFDLGIEAKAADANQSKVLSVIYYDISDYRKTETYVDHTPTGGETRKVYTEYPRKDGYVFGGWYYDKALTNPVRIEDGGDDMGAVAAYAKFVPADVQGSRAQVPVKATYDAATASIRFVSSVDSYRYDAIGFMVTRSRSSNTLIKESTTVYKSLVAADHEVTAAEAFHEKSQYLYALTITGVKNQADTYKAVPYWITLDGTLVKAEEEKVNAKSVELGIYMNNQSDLTGNSTKPITGDADISWYGDGLASEFVLEDAADLRGFAALSQHRTFAGKTIKLGADIALNLGDADGKPVAGDKLMNTNGAIIEGIEYFTPIGNGSYRFAGTFDGQGYTISGLADRSTGYASFFGYVENATIKNLKIARSTMRGGGAGGISAGLAAYTYGTTTIENVYVGKDVNIWNATYFGGIVGRNMGKLTINKAWSEADINPQWATTSHGKDLLIGGIVAANDNVAACTLDLNNCLFTGSVDGSVATHSRWVKNTSGEYETSPYAAYVGGLIGASYNNPTTTITNCLSNPALFKIINRTTTVKLDDPTDDTDEKVAAPIGNLTAGAIVGSKSWTPAKTEASNVYFVQNSCPIYEYTGTDTVATGEYYGAVRSDQSFSSGVTEFAKADLLGDAAKANLTGLDFENTWVTVPGGTPELKLFSTKVDTSWYDANESEFTLMDEADLRGFAYLSQYNNFAGKTIKLGADMAFNEGDSPDETWTPIGNSSCMFAGTFDGQGHTISGLYQTIDSNVATGLFGVINGATIKSVKVTNSYFASSVYVPNGSMYAAVGAIVGRTYGTSTLQELYSDAYLSGGYSSGLISFVDEGTATIDKCWFAGTINGASQKVLAGGIVGNILSKATAIANLSNCLFTGTITGEFVYQNENNLSYIGGLVGSGSWGAKLSIVNSLSAGDMNSIVVPTYDSNGTAKPQGLVGSVIATCPNAKVTADDAATTIYATAETYTQGTYAANRADRIKVEVVNKQDIKGVDAKTNAPELDYENVWTIRTGDVPALRDNSDAIVADTSWYNDDDKEFTITTAAQLLGLAQLVNDGKTMEDVTIKLGNDIVFNDGTAAEFEDSAPTNKWTPIGTEANMFAGTFDGQDHTISGLYMSVNQKGSIGFFGEAQNATIKNIKVTNSYFYNADTAGTSGKHDHPGIGAVVGRTRGGCTLSNLYSDAYLSGGYAVGLVGVTGATANASETSKDTISKSWFAGTFVSNGQSSQRAGGILGISIGGDVDITDCLFTGKTTGTFGSSSYIGGIVGVVNYNASAQVYKSISAGDLQTATYTATSYVGAIAGSGCNISGRGLIVPDANSVYATTECYSVLVGNPRTSETDTVGHNKNIVSLSKDDLLGTNAKSNATGLDYENVWVVRTGNVPALRDNTGAIVADTSWYNETDKEFTITTAAQLLGLAELSQSNDFAGKTIKLGNDITFNEGTAAELKDSAPTNKWTPIGNSTCKFAGTIDGQGNTISGLYTNATTGNAGLCQFANGAIFMDLRLENSYFAANNNSYNAGAIAGNACGVDVRNVYTNAIVHGERSGGIFGQVDNGGTNNISRTWFDGVITTSTDTSRSYAGGFVAHAVTDDGQSDPAVLNITNCLFTGTLSGESCGANGAGGLVGMANGKTTMTSCLSAGSIEARHGAVGSIIGTNYYATRTGTKGENLYATTECLSFTYTSDDGDVVITTVGSGRYTIFTQVNPAIALAELKADNAAVAPGLDYATAWEVHVDGIPTPTKQADDAVDTSWYNANTSKFTLYTAAELRGLAQLVNNGTNFSGKIVKLGADITFNAEFGDAKDWSTAPEGIETWTSIGVFASKYFSGTFDGQGHTISGLYQNTTNGGLFGDVKDGAVKNLKLTNSYIKCNGTSGIISAGTTAGATFADIYVDAIISNTGAQVGGIVGRVYGNSGTTKPVFTNCTVAGTVSGTTIPGGIIGLLAAQKSTVTITDCTVSAAVSGSSDVGGLIGRTDGTSGSITATGCTVSGTVTGTGAVVGGFLGRIAGVNAVNVTVEDASVTNTISGGSDVGGIIGRADGTNGVVNITDATVSGAVNATGNVAGGLVGRGANTPITFTISDVYVSSDVQGASNVGGIIGTTSTTNNHVITANITRATFIGTIQGTGHMGGLIGDGNNGGKITITDSVVSTTISGGTSNANFGVGGVVGRNLNTNSLTLTRVLVDVRLNVPLTLNNQIGAITGFKSGTEDNFSCSDVYVTTETLDTVNTIMGGRYLTGYYDGTTDRRETVEQRTGANEVAQSAVLGTNATTTLTNFDFAYTWMTNADALPTPNMPEVDTSWYDADATEFTLYDAADLRGFAQLSNTNTFEDKTIKLGADIVLNEGNAADWAKDASGVIAWDPIGLPATATGYFKGTFDGQGRSVSGIYVTSSSYGGGFIAFAQAPAEIKNLYLENSYIKCTQGSDWSFTGGVVAGTNGVNYTNVHSNVIIETNSGYVGGIAGRMQGGISNFENCSFGGKLIGTATTANQFGGILGGVSNAENGTAAFTNCTVTGDITTLGKNVGGIVGDADSDKTFAVTFTNCVVEGAVTSTGAQVGGIAGYVADPTTITNATVSGSVGGSQDVGGLVGIQKGDTTIESSKFSGTISGSAGIAGGAVGRVSAPLTIDDFENSGSITGGTKLGGVIGWIRDVQADTAINLTVCEFAADATINSTNTNAGDSGGVIGYMTIGTLTASEIYSAGTVTAANKTVGGFVGMIGADATVSITDSYSFASVSGSGNVGQLIGLTNANVTMTGTVGGYRVGANAATSVNVSNDAQATGHLVIGAGDALLYCYEQGYFDKVDAFMESEKDGVFTINTVEDLYVFSLATLLESNFANKTIKLNADLTINEGDASDWETDPPEIPWLPIGSNTASGAIFGGTFDGQGYTVSGLYAKVQGDANIGFIGCIGAKASVDAEGEENDVVGHNPAVKNLSIKNSHFEANTSSGYSSIGSVVGAILSIGEKATLENLYSDAYVIGTGNASGGILGRINMIAEITISNCWYEGVLRARCGLNGCAKATANQDYHGMRCGGIVGTYRQPNEKSYGSLLISDCLFNGTIITEHAAPVGDDTTGSQRTGGILGEQRFPNVTIQNSVSAGKFMLMDSQHTQEAIDNGTVGFGAVIGSISSKCTDPAKIINCYALDAEFNILRNTNKIKSGNVPFAPAKAVLTGCGVDLSTAGEVSDLALTTGGLDFSNTWNYAEGELPSLKYFTEDDGKDYTYLDTEDGQILFVHMDDATVADYKTTEFAFTEVGTDTGGTYGTLTTTPVTETNGFLGEDYGDKTYLTKYTGVTKDMYTQYVTKLESVGYTKYADNGETGLNNEAFTTSMYIGDHVCTVTYFSRTSEAYVSVSNNMKLSPNLLPDNSSTQAATVAGKKTTLTALPVYHGDNTDSANLASGDAYIMQLKNGHFIVFDGDTTYTLKSVIDHMKELTGGETPIIDAWFVTHGHWDHTGWTAAFINDDGAEVAFGAGTTAADVRNMVRVNGVYLNNISDYNNEHNSRYTYKSADYRYKAGLNSWFGNVKKAADNMKTETGETTPYYRPQAGQRYYFSGLTVEIPYTQEQIMMGEYQLDSNAACTWYLVKEEGGTVFLEAADTENVNMNHVVALYSESYDVFNADIINVFHHGNNSYNGQHMDVQADTLAFASNATYLIYTQTRKKFDTLVLPITTEWSWADFDVISTDSNWLQEAKEVNSYLTGYVKSGSVPTGALNKPYYLTGEGAVTFTIDGETITPSR